MVHRRKLGEVRTLKTLATSLLVDDFAWDMLLADEARDAIDAKLKEWERCDAQTAAMIGLRPNYAMRFLLEHNASAQRLESELVALLRAACEFGGTVKRCPDCMRYYVCGSEHPGRYCEECHAEFLSAREATA